MSKYVRTEWREVLREWSTQIWALALAVAAFGEAHPEDVDNFLGVLPPDTATWVSGVLGFLGLLAKFAPQRKLQQKADVRRRHD